MEIINSFQNTFAIFFLEKDTIIIVQASRNEQLPQNNKQITVNSKNPLSIQVSKMMSPVSFNTLNDIWTVIYYRFLIMCKNSQSRLGHLEPAQTHGSAASMFDDSLQGGRKSPKIIPIVRLAACRIVSPSIFETYLARVHMHHVGQIDSRRWSVERAKFLSPGRVMTQQ